jgi:uncharacterized protein (DUF1015 family)
MPLRGIRFNPQHVHLGGVLAPPYDVISDLQRETLYARDLRNVVRIDYGMPGDADVAGADDRYTRARGFLESWLQLGVLVQDEEPSLYVTEHHFVDPHDGGIRTRRGLIGTVAAVPWEESDLKPHERTMTGPKEDRLALLRAMRVQTSPVFAVWRGAPGVAGLLGEAVQATSLAGGRTDGEFGSEKHVLWRVSGAATAALTDALRDATLYVADGHHRYETAVAYAEQRRAEEPNAPRDAPFSRCLVYLADADDPGLSILPTHRLLRPGRGVAFSVDDLWARLDDAWDLEPAASLRDAVVAAAAIRDTHHAFAVAGADATAVLRRPRLLAGSPRERLDVSVLETQVLAPAGLGPESVTAGALGYTRRLEELEAAVLSGEALLGFAVQPVRIEELIAVADAGEVMPQKSTYFYPKVPTGLVLAPL